MFDVASSLDHSNPFYRVGTAVLPSSVPFEGSRLHPWNGADGKLRVADTLLGNGAPLDISWLPFAAEAYHISADIRDFVIVEIPIVTVGVPNRNLDCFTYEAVTQYQWELGRVAFQTFVGKPTHQDHKNADPTKAKGVHFDAQLVKRGDFYKIVVLAGFDRTKDKDLAASIVRKERWGFSMGCLIKAAYCGVCRTKVLGQGSHTCSHKKGQLYRLGSADHLGFEWVFGLNYIETSSVADPADITAEGAKIWQ